MRLDEVAKEVKKAGFMPYFVLPSGEKEFLFMIPSDPNYGGTRVNIAKGHIDAGESARDAALREAAEELGLKKKNLRESSIALAWEGRVKGSAESYHMSVFAGEVRSKTDFNQPHYETGELLWLTAEQFSETGRSVQKSIVAHVSRSLT